MVMPSCVGVLQLLLLIGSSWAFQRNVPLLVLQQQRLRTVQQQPSILDQKSGNTNPKIPIVPRSVRLWESPSSDNDDNADDARLAKKIAGRQSRLRAGHWLVLVGYGGLAAKVVFVSNPIQPATAWALASGPLLVAGIQQLLLNAATVDGRLASDTYKRLHRQTAVFGMAACIAATWSPAAFGRLFWVLPSAVAMINGIKGYGYGIRGGWGLPQGAMASFRADVPGIATAALKAWTGVFYNPDQQNVSTRNNWKSLAYWPITLFVTSLQVTQLLNLLVRGGSAGFSAVGLLRWAQLQLLTAVTMTLQDAAVRDRLLGTTFVRLNFMAALAYGTMAVYYAAGVNKILAVPAAASAALTLTVGVLSALQKRKQSSEGF